MRIVIWNCRGAFPRKTPYALGLQPDVLIVPESARPDIVLTRADSFIPTCKAWMSRPKRNSEHSGLGCYSFGDYHFSLAADLFNPDIHHALPLRFYAPMRFNVLAIWTHNKSIETCGRGHLGPAVRALEYYEQFLLEVPSIMAGDFNYNSMWDKKNRKTRKNFSDFVTDLSNKTTLVSAYHFFFQENHGNETAPTLFWSNRGYYHVDYCFIPSAWTLAIQSVTVGTTNDWRDAALSDHFPLIIQFNLEHLS